MCATEADLTVSNRAARERNKNTHTYTNQGQREQTTHYRGKTPRPPFRLVGTTAADGIVRESDSWVYLSIQKVMAERRER